VVLSCGTKKKPYELEEIVIDDFSKVRAEDR
jgi:hypothetical protein